MNSIYKTVLMLFLAITLPAQAELTAIEDNHLGDIYGQAIFEITNQDVAQDSGGSLEMIKLTVGARVEINANIDEIALGRYWRPEGTDCLYGGNASRVCDNGYNDAPLTKNISWACTVKPCGSVELEDSNYMSSVLTHGKTLSFFAYPGSFEPESGVDIKLRDVTMGRTNCSNGVCVLEPFVQENPYIELAFDKNASGIRQLAGFRVGSEDSFGIQGNIIDVISGFVRPEVTADVYDPVFDGYLGTLAMAASIGGVRTVGWIDNRNLDVSADSTWVLDLLLAFTTVEALSPTAQLFPVQGNHLDHTKAFFLSANAKPINWSTVGGYSPAVTAPGFWLNMGGDGALKATTQEGDHPINYFPGHPKHALYSASTNYSKNVPTWSDTYQ